MSVSVIEAVFSAVDWLRRDDGEAAYEAGGSFGRRLAGPLAYLLAACAAHGDLDVLDAAERVAEALR